MISISFQTMCISILVILIVGMIIGASVFGSNESSKERESRKIWAEVSQEELKQLGKYKQVDGLKQPPDFIKPKLPIDRNLDDIILNDEEFLKRIGRKKKS